MKTLDAGRIGIAALSLGLAEGACDAAFRYANEQEQFGRKLWDFQGTQFQIADIATDIQAGKHLTYNAAWLKDQGAPFTKEAAMAKLFMLRVGDACYGVGGEDHEWGTATRPTTPLNA
jgi:butyryl-CoA dehydrogenase